ncbi:MAG: hypothetical protein IJ702_09595 [Fretibacterium sp.]|nr:hypothetical protein [Fretibacterium sp.]
MPYSLRRSFALFLALPALVWGGLTAEAKVYVTEPLLVAQPSYAGMQFYVYRPYNMPEGWYVTFDGYPVRKNADGVWVYGSASGPNLMPTNYIVGSVVPSMAGIAPWVQSAQVSELRRLPNVETMAVQQSAPPASRLAQGQSYSTWVPDWIYNTRFMAVGSWKGSVDRIGVLHNPAVPVAWKGSSPQVIYVWTGRSWYQVARRESETAQSALKRELYDITRMVKRNKLVWYEEDMPVLAQQSTAWGYYWMGEVVLPR